MLKQLLDFFKNLLDKFLNLFKSKKKGTTQKEKVLTEENQSEKEETSLLVLGKLKKKRSKKLVNNDYNVTKIGNQIVSKKGITLSVKDNTISGNTGCNDYSSSYIISGENIKIDYTITTSMFCEEKAFLENKLLSSLTKTVYFLQEKEFLYLKDVNDRVLIQCKLKTTKKKPLKKTLNKQKLENKKEKLSKVKNEKDGYKN